MDEGWDDPDPGPADPDGAVRAVRQQRQELDELRGRLDAMTRAGPVTRFLQQRRHRELADDIAGRRHGLADLEGELGAAGVGAAPHRWGVFSGAGDLTLERTIAGLAERRALPQVADAVRELHDHLPELRLAAHAGDRSSEREVEALLVQWSALTTTQRDWRALVEHLPGAVRPLPEALSALDRHGPPVTLSITQGPELDPAPDARIRLHDIVVSHRFRGLGLGTAALVQLCRYADQVAAPITGEVEPGPGLADREHRVARLTAWYGRHGFTVTGRHMRREPRRSPDRSP